MTRVLLNVFLSIVLAVANVGACLAASPLATDSVYQLPLPLTDQVGARYDWRSLRGKPRVVSMFYTSCPFVCPLIVDAGKSVERALTPAERQRIGIVLISLDPAHDTPAALRHVADARKLDLARWTLASPRPQDVRAVAGVLGIRYRQLADGSFNHTAALVLLDAQGRELARTDQVGSQVDPAFVAAVRRAVAH